MRSFPNVHLVSAFCLVLLRGPPMGFCRGWYAVVVDIEDSVRLRSRAGWKGRRDQHACLPVQDGDEAIDPLAAQDG